MALSLTQYREHAPISPLRTQVRSLWELWGSCDDPSPQRLIPDGSMSLWLNFGAEFSCGRTCRVPSGQAVLLGEIRRPFEVASTGALDIVGVSFWAGHARSFVEAHLPEVVNQLLPGPPLVAALSRELRDSVLGAERPERIPLLQAALTRTACVQRAASARIQRALGLLERQELRVAKLAEIISFSTRQLERDFVEQVGATPKQIASVLRFRRALDAMRTGRPRFADIAQQCGYADQAHLIREFTRYAGTPPARFVAAEMPRARAEWLVRAQRAVM